MRIGMVVAHFQEEFGGHEFYLCRELSRMGHEVTVYTSNRTRPGYGESKYILRNHYSVEDFRVERFHAPIEVSEVPIVQGLGRALMEDPLDVIHSHESFQACSFIAWRAAQTKRIPFIITQHGSTGLPLKRSIWLPYLLHKKTVGKYILRKANRIITLTSRGEQALVSNGIAAEKITTIHTGVPTELYKPSLPSILPEFGVREDERVVLFVGRLVENKGVHILLQAFNVIQKRVEAVKLVIIGSGTMKDHLHSMVNALGIEKKVLFIGKLPQERMPYVYSGADVFVLPTLYTEPFGIAAVEALSSGVPVIVSSIGGLKEIVKNGENGYLVQPGNVNMLVQSIIDLLKNEDKKKRFSKKARETALNEFSWEKIGRKVEQTYAFSQAESANALRSGTS